MKLLRRSAFALFALILVGWCVLSVVVELEVSQQAQTFSNGRPRALILFHPSWVDSFQDELTSSFAQGLTAAGWGVNRMTIDSGSSPDITDYDLIAFGTNTYYWRPDLPTMRLLAKLQLAGRRCVALVSGAGSTQRAERLVGELIARAGGSGIEVRPFWLWRPNDESRLAESNRAVALDKAREFGARLAIRD